MGNPSIDLTLITDSDSDAVRHPAWPRFARAMQGRITRCISVLDHWCWFRDGWDAKISQLKAASTDEWCDTW